MADKETGSSSKGKERSTFQELIWPYGSKKKEAIEDDGTFEGSTSTDTSRRPDVSHIETAQDKKKTTLWQKSKRHCGRFWLWYLIALIIFLAIFLPLLFLKIVPALAQLILDKTDVPLNTATLRAVGKDKVQVGITTELTLPAGIKVKLKPLQLDLYNNFTEGGIYPFANISTQRTLTLQDTTKLVIADQYRQPTNMTELHKWLEGMFHKKEHLISAKGTTKAYLGKLGMNLTLKKTIPIKAQNDFAGMDIGKLSLILPAMKNGTNLRGEILLPNWSDFVIGLGDLYFNVLVGDIKIGVVTIPDVVLPPGNNTRSLTGTVDLPNIVSNLVTILGSQGAAISRGAIELGITGNKTMINGEHIVYLERVLNPMLLKVNLPIFQLVGDILGSITSGDLDLGSLLNEAGPGVKDLVDGVLGGGNETDSGGGSGGGLLNDLLDNFEGRRGNGGNGRGGNGGGGSDTPLSDILDGLGGGGDGGGGGNEKLKRDFMSILEAEVRKGRR